MLKFIESIGLEAKHCTAVGTDGCSVMGSVEAGATLWDEIQKSGQNPKFENFKSSKYIHANDTQRNIF